jgi:hypothetical protein
MTISNIRIAEAFFNRLDYAGAFVKVNNGQLRVNGNCVANAILPAPFGDMFNIYLFKNSQLEIVKLNVLFEHGKIPIRIAKAESPSNAIIYHTKTMRQIIIKWRWWYEVHKLVAILSMKTALPPKPLFRQVLPLP